MKKSSSKSPRKGKQINNQKSQAPDMHDVPQRRQPPTPQDIHRVQPVSQAHNKDQPGKSKDSKSHKGPH